VVTGGGQQGAPGFRGDRLRAARRAAGMTQLQLSAEPGVHEMVVANWERGQRVPRVDRLRELARALNVSAADLTDLAEDGPASLQALRVAASLLQEQVAARAGLTRTKYAALERGEIASLSQRDCAALAAVLGVGVGELRTAHAVSRAGPLVRCAAWFVGEPVGYCQCRPGSRVGPFARALSPGAGGGTPAGRRVRRLRTVVARG
jgi:transcriptional regulator with XRE-family HTH domain